MHRYASPLVGKTIDWRAGCGRSARPVRREGGPNPIGSPYPYQQQAPNLSFWIPACSRESRIAPRDRSAGSVVLIGGHLPAVDTTLDRNCRSCHRELGNDAVEGATAIAEHKGVLDNGPVAEIDRLEAGAVRIDIVVACLTQCERRTNRNRQGNPPVNSRLCRQTFRGPLQRVVLLLCSERENGKCVCAFRRPVRAS